MTHVKTQSMIETASDDDYAALGADESFRLRNWDRYRIYYDLVEVGDSYKGLFAKEARADDPR